MKYEPSKILPSLLMRLTAIFQVYCCGQPTKQGFENILETVTKSYPKEGPIVWINMRQEPSVYVNGSPMCARPPNKECANYNNLIYSFLNIPTLF